MVDGMEGLAGGLSVDVEMDVSGVESGLDRIEQGLESAQRSAQGAFGDIQRMGDAVGSVVGPMVKLGTAAAGSFATIATQAPQVAPFLEKMKTDFFRLSAIAGEELTPAFEAVSSTFEGFVNFMDSDGRPILDTINSTIVGLTEGFQDMGSAIAELPELVGIEFDIELSGFAKTVAEELGPEAAMTAMGFKFGGATGAAAGAAAAKGADLAGGFSRAGEQFQEGNTMAGLNTAFRTSIGPGGRLIVDSATGAVRSIWNQMNQKPQEDERTGRMRDSHRGRGPGS